MSAGAMFKKVVRGGALFSMGTIGARALQFVSGLLVIRLVSTADYGFISLAYVLINVVATISTLGFMSGLPRFMAAQANGAQDLRARAAISTAIFIGLTVATISSVLIYAGAPLLGHAFGKEDLIGVLKLFSLLILPIATLNILSAIFRGLGNAKPKVWFVDLLLNASRLALFCLVFIVGTGFETVLWAYVASAWLAMLVFGLYATRSLRSVLRLTIDPDIAKELLIFSLPLLGVALATNVMGWGGTLVLGALSSPEEVAFFSVSMRMVFLITLPLVAVSYLYLPVATDLIVNDDRNKLRELYAITTKWVFLLTLPLLLYFLLDTKFIIVLLFGERYIGVDWVLRVLVIGYSFSTFFGPNGSTLMSVGKSNTVFIGVLLAAGGSITLSLLLVPMYGALGAALGTMFAQFISNSYLSTKLYASLQVKPFSGTYLKPVIVAAMLSVGVASFTNIAHQPGWALHVLFFILLVVFALISPFLTMTMTVLDVELLAWGERRFLRSTWMSDRLGKIVAAQRAGNDLI